MTHLSTVLPDRALIAIRGADAENWLQGLVTQSVAGLEAGSLRHTALLSPQGKVLADGFVTSGADGLVLDVDAELRASLIARLSLYRLRAQVDLAAVDGGVTVGWGGPAPAGAHPDPRLAEIGWRALVPVAAPGGAVPADYIRHRRSLGVAEIAADGLAERIYAVEANFDLLNGVDFHKGCFIGQEITSRMYRRGGAKSRILPFASSGKARPGDDVLNGDLRAGEVVACADGIGLALVRLDRSAGGLSVGGEDIVMSPPTWMSAASPNSGHGPGSESASG